MSEFPRPKIVWTNEDADGEGLFIDEILPAPGPFIQKCYQMVIRCLYQFPSEVPKLKVLHVTCRTGIDPPAFAQFFRQEEKANLVLNIRYFKRCKSEDIMYELSGVLIHELVHVAQYDGDGTAGHAFIEGIADYVRFQVGFPARHWPLFGYRPKMSKRKWNDGYETSAYFFAWIEEQYLFGFVYHVNLRLKQKHEDSSLIIEELTGKSVHELWAEYAENDTLNEPSQN
ncbi:hypothetical protein MP638_000080 [Amoeboaphelidium occidentale]|nr:hypothetical protein MP638_000080 [Amoeboaphelidium occidentale]